MARTGGPCGTPQSTVLGILHGNNLTLSLFLGAVEHWLEQGVQEGAGEVAFEGAVPDVCRPQAQRWPSPTGRRPSGFNGSQMHKIPWKQVAVVKGMTASPGAPFLGLLQARETVSTVLKILWTEQSLSKGELCHWGLHPLPDPKPALPFGCQHPPQWGEKREPPLRTRLCQQGEAGVFLLICWPFSLFLLLTPPGSSKLIER